MSINARARSSPARRSRRRRMWTPLSGGDAGLLGVERDSTRHARARCSGCGNLDDHLEELARLVTTERGDARRIARQRPAHRVRGGRLRRRLCSWVTAWRTWPGARLSGDAPAHRCVGSSRRSIFPRWSRSGSCRSRSRAGTRSCSTFRTSSLSQQRICELLQQCDLPPGVVNIVHGGREVAGDVRSPADSRRVLQWDPRPSLAPCISARLRRVSASRPSMVPRISSSSCPTPIWIGRFRRSPSRSMAVPAGGVSPVVCCCRWERRALRPTIWSRRGARLAVGDGLESGVQSTR